MLKYPTWTLFDFSQVTTERWNLFISVDVLQLIGVSLLILLAILYFTEKLNLNYDKINIEISYDEFEEDTETGIRADEIWFCVGPP